MEDQLSLRIMSIVVDTTVDGPGWRTSIYCAGCRHACSGCHNPETWNFDAGYEATIDEIMDQLRHTEGGITFSGGDPMYQALAFTALARRIKQDLHRDIWCYTGFKYEAVIADPSMSALLDYVDVLVDGPFIEAERSLDLLFRGSANQRLIDVAKSRQTQTIVEYGYDPYPSFD